MRQLIYAMTLAGLIGTLAASPALAEIVPNRGIQDPRVRVIDYDPLNVVRLSTFFGVSTHVQFGDDETITDVAVGDDQAWKVVPRQSHLFIKPLADHADTNVTVVTNKRTYQFALVVHPKPEKSSSAWKDPNLIFSLSFRYPDEAAARRQASAQRQAERDREDRVSALLDGAQGSSTPAPKPAAGGRRNYDYWVAGKDPVSPTSAYDDGRYIYLTFANNRDIPAVYAVNEEGKEALINTHVINGRTVVVQRLVQRLMLRRGAAVASVINKSFDPDGGKDNTSGTVSPQVIRVVKGSKR